MAIRRSSSENSESNNEKKFEPLIPGLPDDIAELCLLHIPYPYQTLVRSVSSSWNSAITNPSFRLSKTTLSLSLPNLFVLAFHKSTFRIQWQSFDPRSRRWFVLPPMPCPKDVSPPGFACASLPLQGKLFVLGGSTVSSSLQTTISYRASTNQWSLASPMLNPRSFFAAGEINGKIFAAGGSRVGDGASVSAVECYNPANDTWTKVAKMRVGLMKYDAAVVGKKLYVTEGWKWPFHFIPRGGVYDGEKDTWHEMSVGMREGWTGISVVLADRLFVISEHGDCPMKVYVPDDDTWQYVGGERFPCEVVKRPLAVCGVEGRIYVVSCGLHVAVGKVFESEKRRWRVEWEVVEAPVAFRDLSPSNCLVLFA